MYLATTLFPAARCAKSRTSTITRSYSTLKSKTVPPKRGNIQDTKSFLESIGRKSSSAADKFKDWDHLFTASTSQMKELGLTPQQRKYILRWTEKYRHGWNLTEVKEYRSKKR
ncbi:IGR protein motif-domain-containing protein [Paraphysoderma sedebokerense]|nr:IGR protein motif-domain-containing protein [Paraphysoderma sedebokerense]